MSFLKTKREQSERGKIKWKIKKKMKCEIIEWEVSWMRNEVEGCGIYRMISKLEKTY
jgi:LEA14-like dessication related protein